VYCQIIFVAHVRLNLFCIGAQCTIIFSRSGTFFVLGQGGNLELRQEI
jgi:hypothetical protein